MKTLLSCSLSTLTIGSLLVAFSLSSCDKEAKSGQSTSSTNKPEVQKLEKVSSPPAPAAVTSQQASNAPDQDADSQAVAADSGEKTSADKVSSESAFEIVTDPDSILIEEGSARPKKGDKIYTFATLPEDGCGTYWVRDQDGKVAQVAICRDEH